MKCQIKCNAACANLFYFLYKYFFPESIDLAGKLSNLYTCKTINILSADLIILTVLKLKLFSVDRGGGGTCKMF